MLRRAFSPLLLAGLAVVTGCDGATPWGGGREESRAVIRPDFGPTAAYDRRMIFLGPGARLPTAAVFDFESLSDSAGVRRGVRARLVDGSEWIPILDAGWEIEPMREPWRLIPHGPLKVLVTDAGEIAALVVRDDPALRLVPGPTIAEHSPDAGTQLVLRQARLLLSADAVPGVLLDAQLGRAVNPAFSPRPPGGSGGDGGDPNPAARPGAEALLLDNEGYYAVVAESSAGALAWTHALGRDEVHRGGRLEAIQWELFQEGAVQFPTQWRITAPGGALTGELTAEAADRSVLPGGDRPSALGYVLVTGWIEDRGVRREVFGLVRHVL